MEILRGAITPNYEPCGQCDTECMSYSYCNCHEAGYLPGGCFGKNCTWINL